MKTSCGPSRQAVLVKAALLYNLVGTASGDGDPRGLRRQLSSVESRKSSNPYHPAGIVDPFSDIKCNATEGISKVCKHNNDCDGDPYRLCIYYPHCEQKQCLHKNLFPMLDGDLGLFVLMFAIAVCAGAAGIGGGGLNVPILMMVGSFGIKEAVPLSHAAVMGNAFAQLLVNAPQRHPNAPVRPLIHYELAILALPAQLGGNSLGVVVGQIFPPTLLIVLSLSMLLIAATKTGMKAVETFKKFKESRRVAVSAPDQLVSLPVANGIAAGGSNGSHEPPGSPSQRFKAAGSSSALPYLDKELKLPTSEDNGCVRTWSGTNILSAALMPARRSGDVVTSSSPPEPEMRVPWLVISTMIAFNIVFCIDFILLSDEVKCHTWYWIFLIGLYPFVVASIWVGIKSLQALAAFHHNRGDPAIPGDPEVSMKLVIMFPLAAVVIGLVAGLVGLGGGEFMVPLLLEFGLQPRVAAGTSGFLILFTTSSNIVHYFIAGIMEPFLLYGLGVFIVAFFGALTGLMLRDTKLLKEHNYLLVVILTCLLFISAGLLAYRGFGMSSLDWGFKPFCPVA